MFGSMEERPARTVPRSQFSDRQVKEFNKTAAMIALAPWHLEAATTYLLKLVQDNIDGQADHWVAPGTSFGLTFKDPSEPEPVPTLPSAVAPADLQFANRAPAPVNVRVRLHKKTAAAVPELRGIPAAEPELPDASDDADENIEKSESEVMLPDEVDVVDGPRQNPGAGCPPHLRGRGGAPARVANLESSEPILKRPAAAVKAKSQPKRRCLSKLPFPDGAIEALEELKRKGHTKCRTSKFGCAECRKKAGLVLNEDGTAWQWKSEGR